MALEESITDRPVAHVGSQGVSAAVTAASLKATVLPELFANTSRISSGALLTVTCVLSSINQSLT